MLLYDNLSSKSLFTFAELSQMIKKVCEMVIIQAGKVVELC
jgi:hypothetical protein